ncbi:hypothetical protein C8J55DRAFT_548855 [Lentinula edodes]|uniref:Uncharacterized protein n=1 Tax=Lentinula lateritia TaxID=40482 RepID=A0A9W9AHC5_9AGAR|nr:hypothetical protein C8J55DRAFT_548855 [Lentinula edodes]
MSLQAYYHDNKAGDPDRPHHSSRSVSMEYVRSLGINTTTIEGPDFEGNARIIAKEQSYPLTENSSFIWNLHDLDQSSPLIKDYAQKIEEGSRDDFYLDVEDPREQAWIRIEVPQGTLCYLPAGAFRRVATEGTKVCMFIKDTGADENVLWDKEAEGHPVHQEYLNNTAS